MYSGDKLYIAVVEDNEFFNRLFCEQLRMLINHSFHLEQQNFHIDAFNSPEEFLLSSRKNFDLIFLDYFFYNNITAAEAIKPIRKKYPYAEIYIFSEWMSSQSPELTILPEVDGYLAKDAKALLRCQEILTHFIPQI